MSSCHFRCVSVFRLPDPWGEGGKEGWIPYPGQSAAQRPANPQLSRLPDKLRKEWCIERVNGATSSRGPPTPNRPHPRNQGVFLRLLVWRRGRNVCPQQPPITPIVFHGRKQSVRGHVVTLPPLTTISTTSQQKEEGVTITFSRFQDIGLEGFGEGVAPVVSRRAKQRWRRGDR